MSADSSKKRTPKRPAAPRSGPDGKGRVERTSTQAPETPDVATGGGFRPPHLFVVASLVAAGGGAWAASGTSPVNAAFVSLAVGSVGVAAFLLYRTVWPLVAPAMASGPDMVGGRTRAALEREKAALLRAIKELEFDRAMRKVSEADFQDMSGRLRSRAVRLIRQLDSGSAGYRELIEKELAARVAAVDGSDAATVPDLIGEAPSDMTEPGHERTDAGFRACAGCGVLNDSDAQFCKQCGNKLLES